MLKWSDFLRPEWIFCNITLITIILAANFSGMSFIGASLVVITVFNLGYMMGQP